METKKKYQKPETDIFIMEIEGEVFTPSVPSSGKNPGNLGTSNSSMLDMQINLMEEDE